MNEKNEKTIEQKIEMARSSLRTAVIELNMHISVIKRLLESWDTPLILTIDWPQIITRLKEATKAAKIGRNARDLMAYFTNEGDPDPAKKSLLQLISEAKESCEARGHNMVVIAAALDKALLECTECGEYVHVTENPAPNGIDIGGPAVAVDCPKIKKT